ncbi:MAG: recombinase family protein [Dehalococcoidia bacterium]
MRGAPLVGAYPPYGYQWLTETRHEKIVKTTLALDPLRAPIVRSLFEDAAAGRSIRHLAADLNARDVPSVKGRPWQTSSVHSLLRNPIYTGTVVAFRHRAIKDATSGKVTKVVRRHADDPEVIETKNAVPAIVSEELFEAVAERFTANKAMASRNHHDPEATLLRGGYAICGHCGGTMYAHTRKPRPGYQYRCVSWQYDPARCRQHTIVAEILDDAVWQRVSAVLRDPDLIARKIEELRANDPTAGDLAGFEREIAKVTKQRDTYLANVGNAPTVEVAGLMMGKVAQLSDELARLEAERDAINARREAWEAAQTALRDLQAGCARVAERLEHAPYERKREALDYLGVRVKVFRQGSPERYVIEAVTATPSGEIVSTIGAGRTR